MRRWRKEVEVLVALLILLAANFLVVWGQSFVSFWKWRHLAPCLMPEARYYLQSLVVLVPLIPLVLLRFRHGRKLLVILLLALLAHAAGYLAKAHVPGSRRNLHLAACDWAVAAIRADYKGPKQDAEPYFSQDDYHPLGRPVVSAHVARVPYLLGGRVGEVFVRREATGFPSYLALSPDQSCFVDLPDYIVDEPDRIDPLWWAFADYEKMAERRFGTRDFVIYRKIADKAGRK